jgi:hypothetical protein
MASDSAVLAIKSGINYAKNTWKEMIMILHRTNRMPGHWPGTEVVRSG